MTKKSSPRDAQREHAKKQKAEHRKAQGSVDSLKAPNTSKFVGMVSKTKARRSHNCLHKDKGQTHVMRNRCFELGHMGVCPTCRHPASMKFGCGPCGSKPRDLMTLKESQAAANGAIAGWRAEMEAEEKKRRANYDDSEFARIIKSRKIFKSFAMIISRFVETDLMHNVVLRV